MKRRKTARSAKAQSWNVLHPQAARKENPDIPVEIILIILSYLPSGLPVPYTEPGDIIAKDHRYRSDTLSALSQTCRTLWYTCQPLVWEHFAVCASAGEHAGVSISSLSKDDAESLSRKIAMDLAHKMEAVAISDPNRTNLVRVVTVSLSLFSAKNLFPRFARALASFINLEIVQILTIPREYCVGDRSLTLNHLRNAFKKHVFPTVHTLTLTCPAADILPSFPSVRTLITRDWGHPFGPVDYLRHVLKGVRLHLSNVTALSIDWKGPNVLRGDEFNKLVQFVVDASPKVLIFPLRFQLYTMELGGLDDWRSLIYPMRLFDPASMPVHRLKCLTTIDFEADYPGDVHSSAVWARLNHRKSIDPAKALLREIHSNAEPLPAGMAPTKRLLRIFYKRPAGPGLGPHPMEVIEVVQQ